MERSDAAIRHLARRRKGAPAQSNLAPRPRHGLDRIIQIQHTKQADQPHHAGLVPAVELTFAWVAKIGYACIRDQLANSGQVRLNSNGQSADPLGILERQALACREKQRSIQRWALALTWEPIEAIIKNLRAKLR